MESITRSSNVSCPTRSRMCCYHSASVLKQHRVRHVSKPGFKGRLNIWWRFPSTCKAVAGEGSQERADVQLAPRPPAFSREQTMEVIKNEAPFITSRDALADKFQFTPVLQYPPSPSPAAYILNNMHLRAQMSKDLDDMKLEVTRVFSPEPASVIVRWTVAWTHKNEAATVEGSTTYKLSQQGLITSAKDLWTVKGQDSSQNLFDKSFAWAMAFRPPNASKLSWNSLQVAMKFSAWQALKDNPMYGGQMTQEELEALTAQMMYAAVGLGASLAFLTLVVLAKIAF